LQFLESTAVISTPTNRLRFKAESIAAHSSSSSIEKMVEQQSDSLAAITESTQHAPWTVLSALATEYAQSVRHPVRGAALPPQPGFVQQETQTIDVEGKTDLRPDVPTQLADSKNTTVPEDRVDRQAAQREAARVATKFVSSTDVVLRFDFMKSKDTRVSTAQQRRMARSTVHINKASCYRPHLLLC